LEAGLAKVAQPSLQRQDFGRDADDADTFIGSGTVDGEVRKGKLTNLKHTKTQDPFGGGGGKSSSLLGGGRPKALQQQPLGALGGIAAPGGNSRPPGGNPFGDPFGSRGGNGDDDDSEESEEEDLFADINNPFRQKTPYGF